MRARAAMLVVGLAACGPPPTLDAGAPDAGAPDAASTIAPEPPRLGPCPDGWREVRSEPDGLVRCDPWPAEGRRACAGEATHLPGEAGCTTIGQLCPTNGWPTGLPSDRVIVFVEPEGTGDGSSREAALGSLEDAVAMAPAGAIVAIRTGSYDVAALAPASDVTLWGACPSQTFLSSSRPTELATITLDAPRSGARQLSIVASATTGVLATAQDTFLEDVVITETVELGVEAVGGSLRIERALISDVRGDAAGLRGIALSAVAGARVELFATAIERARFVAIRALDMGTHVTVRDVVVSDTRPRELDGTKGRAIDIELGASATLERVVIDHARDVGLFVGNDASSCDARDLVILETQPEEATLRGGIGAVVDAGGHLALERVWIRGSHDSGILGFGVDAVLEATDVVIEETRERVSTGTHGMGLSVNQGAQMHVSRVAISDARAAGVVVSGPGARVDGADVTIADVRGTPTSGEFGAGVWAQQSGAIHLSRASIRDVRVAGVAALTEAVVELDDLGIAGVELAACAPTSCADRSGGFGVSAHLGAIVRATRFTIADSAVCGVVVGEAAELDLATGIITNAPVGACVQVDGYDTARLRRDVEYRDVDVPLQATSYALPDSDTF